MYSQKWNCNYQNRIIMFCLPVPTLIYLWRDLFRIGLPILLQGKSLVYLLSPDPKAYSLPPPFVLIYVGFQVDGWFSRQICFTREYWMIHKRPCFLAIVWFGSSLPPLSSANCLSYSVFLCVAGPAYWRTGEDGAGVEPNHTTSRN